MAVLTPYQVTLNRNHPEVIRLAGWSFHNNGKQGCVIRLREGTARGAVLAVITTQAGCGATEVLDSSVLNSDVGVFVDARECRGDGTESGPAAAGSITGVLYRG